MIKKEKAVTTVKREQKTVYVPVINLRMMTDEEWNRLAYKNYQERRAMV